MLSRPALALLAAFAAACGDAAGAYDDSECGDPVVARAVSFNLANKQGDGLLSLTDYLAEVAPDFMSLQELADGDAFERAMPAHYRLAAAPQSGVGLAFDSERWLLDDHGFIKLGDNDDGWGARYLHWARFEDAESGHCVVVASTHYCVSIRNDTDACDVDRQLSYSETSIEALRAVSGPRTPILWAGDFNVFDGFEEGEVTRAIRDAGFADLLRQKSPEGELATFQGNSWAPAGRIDYIFASQAAELHEAYVDSEAFAVGEGSDHHPLVVELEFRPFD